MCGGQSTTPSDDALFVSEEDSGLTLFRVATLSEPDHYAVLIERMRRRYRCSAIHHLQLDLYTDDWLLLEFPIVRLTGICEREGGTAKGSGDKKGKKKSAKSEKKATSDNGESDGGARDERDAKAAVAGDGKDSAEETAAPEQGREIGERAAGPGEAEETGARPAQSDAVKPDAVPDETKKASEDPATAVAP